MSPASRKQTVRYVKEKLGYSERKICQALGQHRATQRYELKVPQKDRVLIEAIKIEKDKRKHYRYGYRRILRILRRHNWIVNHKRMHRVWRQEGFILKKRHRRHKHTGGGGENACDRRPPEYMNHIWSYDIIEDKLEKGRKVRILNIIDEFTRESLSVDAGFKVTGYDVTEVLRYLFNVRGAPGYIRSDNGPEFINRQVKKFLADSGVDTLYIEPGSPWENGYAESFNSKFRDELLNGELFLHIDELRYVVERWRMDYNHYRPHSSLSYMTPAEFAKLCVDVGCVRVPKEVKSQEILSQRLD